MHIYKITNKTNGKVYIGQHNGSNPDYFASGSLIKRLVYELGEENFEREIIRDCRSKKEMDFFEWHYVTQFNSIDKDHGYNLKMPYLEKQDITITVPKFVLDEANKLKTSEEITKEVAFMKRLFLIVFDDNMEFRYPDPHEEMFKVD
tara:strand:+ start:73 stop:513 length:441 start_codon:yes stop_codon:yes gene_type:complete